MKVSKPKTKTTFCCLKSKKKALKIHSFYLCVKGERKFSSRDYIIFQTQQFRDICHTRYSWGNKGKQKAKKNGKSFWNGFTRLYQMAKSQ